MQLRAGLIARIDWRETIMLILGRRENEAVVIGGQIIVKVVKIRGGRVTLGFDAPRGTVILRSELTGTESAEPAGPAFVESSEFEERSFCNSHSRNHLQLQVESRQSFTTSPTCARCAFFCSRYGLKKGNSCEFTNALPRPQVPITKCPVLDCGGNSTRPVRVGVAAPLTGLRRSLPATANTVDRTVALVAETLTCVPGRGNAGRRTTGTAPSRKA